MRTRTFFGVRSTLVGVAAALLLLLGACGGDDADGLDEYAAAISAGIQADDDADSVEIEPDEADCIGTAAAEVIGLEAFEEVGTPEEVTEQTEDDLSVFDLSDDDSVDIAEEYLDCVPSVFDQFIERFAEGDDDLAACLDDALDENDLVEVVAASVRGDDDAEVGATLTTAFETCSASSGDDGGTDPGDDDTDADDDTDDDQAGGEFEDYRDAVAANILATDGQAVGITASEADCIATATLETIGQERATALGSPDEFVTTTNDDFAALDLEEAELATIARAYLDCSAASGDGFRQIFIESAGATDDQVPCLTDLLTDDLIVELLTETFGGGDGQEFLAANRAAFEACT